MNQIQYIKVIKGSLLRQAEGVIPGGEFTNHQDDIPFW